MFIHTFRKCLIYILGDQQKILRDPFIKGFTRDHFSKGKKFYSAGWTCYGFLFYFKFLTSVLADFLEKFDLRMWGYRIESSSKA